MLFLGYTIGVNNQLQSRQQEAEGLIFKDSGETNVGKADVWVDTEYCLCADPHINNWLHCNAVILFNEKETKEHIVRIEIPKEEREKCFTILGFGYVK